MRIFLMTGLAILLAACSSDNSPSNQGSNSVTKTVPLPPLADRRDHEIQQLGRTRNDPYSWIKQDNWQEMMRDTSLLNNDIKAYLEAENTYTKAALLEGSEELRQTIFEEMKGRIKEDDSSVPAIHGEYAYYTRYREGGQYAIHARFQGTPDTPEADRVEEILIDGDELGKSHEYFDFGGVAHSPNHQFIAYSYDATGSEYYTIYIKDLATGELLEQTIENSTGDFVWNADSNVLYWVWRDENARSARVYRRHLSSASDALIYDETDSGFFVSVSKSESGAYIFIQANDHTTSEIRFASSATTQGTSDFKLISRRAPGVEYSVTHHGDHFYVLTNADDAVDFKIAKTSITSPSRENWQTHVAHKPGTLILGLGASAGHLVRLERENALPRIVIEEIGGESHEIEFDQAAYALDLRGSYEFDTTNLRFAYSSPSQPEQIFDYDMATHQRVLRKTQEVPSGHNPDDYVVERINITSHDGAEVPVTLLRHKDTPVDGTAPLLLYGYGSYGITIPADFGTREFSLVDRGFIWATAHIRGSMAKGYGWYLDGKLDKKTNTFKDYVSAGRALIEKGYTNEGKIVGYGGSAGGLLMGAAVNMDPNLFAGIIAAVPFVDVLNTMSDAELPLTPPEWPEWGNPITDEKAYDTILAYSPYDQVKDQHYPSMLITGGLTDPRVTYWEPTKWIARLRHEAPANETRGPYYLHMNMGAGHGGASGRFDALKERAIYFAFAIKAVEE